MKIEILVLSCDKYKDLWDGFFYQLNKFIPKNININFGCNEYEPKNLYKNNINIIKSGIDTSWENSFRKILNQLESEYILITLEDLYLNNYINLEIIKHIEILIEKGVEINHVKCNNIIKGKNSYGEYLEEIEKEAPYRVTLCGIWKKNYLLKLLKKNESPWDFEVNGSARAAMDNGFYSVKVPILENINMVEKGLWNRRAIKWALKNNIPINPNTRKYKTLIQEVFYFLKNVYFTIIMNINFKYRLKIYKFIKQILVIH